MLFPDDPVGGILGIKGVEEERGQSGTGYRRPRRKTVVKPGTDSVEISPRARRLAKIEEMLVGGDAEEGPDFGG